MTTERWILLATVFNTVGMLVQLAINHVQNKVNHIVYDRLNDLSEKCDDRRTQDV